MLVTFFKSNQKVINAFVIVLSVLLWIPSLWMNQNVLPTYKVSPFYFDNKIIVFLVSSLLIGLQAVYLNYLISEFKLLRTRTHLPALIFVFLNAGSVYFLTFSSLLIINTLLLIIVHQLFLIYNQGLAFSLAFKVGFLIAVASLIYFPIIVMFPLLWFVLFYTKTPNWRELVISILGFTVPIAFYVSYYFVTDQMMELISFNWGGYQIFEIGFSSNNILRSSFFYVLFAVAVFTGLHFLKTISQHVVKIRKYLVILLLFLCLMVVLQLFKEVDNIASYILMTIPLSVFVADFFNEIKRGWLAELVLVCLVVAIAVGHFS